MKNGKRIILAIVVMAFSITSFSQKEQTFRNSNLLPTLGNSQNQQINIFVTHGHCSLPFSGKVNDLKVTFPNPSIAENPLEEMKLSFEIDPNTFKVFKVDTNLTEQVRKPGLFINEQNDKMTFVSTNVYTNGQDWYQINGILSIKGVKKEVTFFATGIRDPKTTMSKALIIEGRLELFDWGIDYDKIVRGEPGPVSTKTMHMNMKIDLL